jgi:very-short-patch-repair endonuclease
MSTLPVAGRIAAVARRQHGLVTRVQLLDLGLSPRQIEGWRANGHLDRILPGVFRVAGTPTTRDQQFTAATLWGGSHARLSHRAGGELWGFDVAPAAKPEITVPASVRKRSALVVVHQTRSPLTDRRIRHGIPVTSPERTLIDLAAGLSAAQLEIAFESARRERHVTAESVERALARIGTQGRVGTEQLQGLLRELEKEPPAESALEVLTARMLRATDLPKPLRQVEVVASGRKHRLDFAWPDQRVALECDGLTWHEMGFERDRSRWSAITAETGYRFVFTTKGRLQREPALIVTQISQLLCEPVTAAPGSGS